MSQLIERKYLINFLSLQTPAESTSEEKFIQFYKNKYCAKYMRSKAPEIVFKVLLEIELKYGRIRAKVL